MNHSKKWCSVSRWARWRKHVHWSWIIFGIHLPQQEKRFDIDGGQQSGGIEKLWCSGDMMTLLFVDCISISCWSDDKTSDFSFLYDADNVGSLAFACSSESDLRKKSSSNKINKYWNPPDWRWPSHCYSSFSLLFFFDKTNTK